MVIVPSGHSSTAADSPLLGQRKVSLLVSHVEKTVIVGLEDFGGRDEERSVCAGQMDTPMAIRGGTTIHL
jgi:hypothetical protein